MHPGTEPTCRRCPSALGHRRSSSLRHALTFGMRRRLTCEICGCGVIPTTSTGFPLPSLPPSLPPSPGRCCRRCPRPRSPSLCDRRVERRRGGISSWFYNCPFFDRRSSTEKQPDEQQRRSTNSRGRGEEESEQMSGPRRWGRRGGRSWCVMMMHAAVPSIDPLLSSPSLPSPAATNWMHLLQHADERVDEVSKRR